MRHGERVSAYVTMGKQGANVGDERQVARLPQAPAQGSGCQHSGDGKHGLCAAKPFLRKQRLLALGAATFFHVCQHAGYQHQHGRPGGERVVLLIRRDGERTAA